ncbi:MAG: AAA family ATPase, partial [Cetobacterium somerae]|uniref:AAA family ATPase n=1 Tax=Cetobacterium somerae TaxID=188913 RepID=UPI003F2C3A33
MTVKNIVSTSNKKVLKFQGKEKLKRLIENLNIGLIGKEDIIKTSLLSILAQENLILFGPPGTAKSEISRRISSVIDTGNYFEYLLTKFTTPEEIFGPLSIKELKEDRFYRKTEGYLPTVQIGFLDEIFKANSSILNTLLTIMNEKVFHNGSKKENTNLISLMGASNENPSNDLELSALYDRFLVRKIVNYIQDDEIDQLFDISGEKFVLNESLKITRKEISDIEENLSKIAIPKDIREVIKKIRLDLKEEFKENNQEEISDRKLVKVLKLLKVAAYTNERDQVDISDVLLLKNCLWNNPENQKVVSDTIINNIKNGYKLIEISNENKFFGIHNDRTLKKFDFKGMGTESNPFIIEDENDLIHIGTIDYLDKGYYFKQSKDISIVSHWHSIGSEEKPFKGNYNGNNKSITKLNNALFFKIDGSIIKNLTLNEVDINSILEKVGALCNIG